MRTIYFNTDFFMRKTNTYERKKGKVNMRQGLIAAAVVAGILGVVLCLSYGHHGAVLSGVAASVLAVLFAADPLGILRKKSRQDEPDNRRE